MFLFLIDLYLFQKLLCSGHPCSHLHCSNYVRYNASHEHVQWESSAAGKNVACSVNFTNSGDMVLMNPDITIA